ncbi:3-oxoacyl-[acyl-carrier-protein] synthase 3 [Aquicella siphonis]|uniref:Beta-ketoacyl-[acyl-carrier-protein] synthase III n=1 Tax=Aquicella siphonis TaxID=254247 RepID=A0A5E4PHX1_9COXI|nr:beta-ketoacyl-ACP synthase III [Aquicella siphonis]VVC75921.1 3-oxoacyl-[acyl-carrier-protein] synthase 3 [Aquicella siphonis]
MTYSKILGTGSYLPKKILTNFDLEKMVETTNAWIVERTGIHERHVAADNENAVTMAEQAGRIALEAAGIKPADVGMIIVSSTTPHMVFPSTACLLQEKYKIAGCPAFDLNASACAGFMYAFSIADQYIRTGAIKNALVIGSEVMSRVIDWEDRSTCVLFGDGAGAVVLGASDTPGILSTHLHADGTHKDVLYLPLGSGKSPNLETVKMMGNQLFKLAVNTLGDLFDETLAVNGMQKSDIDWLVPHQANMRIIDAMAKKLNLPMERVAITLDKQGNTSSASIPLALDQAVRDGRIQRGQILMMEGFGGGLAWGSALVKY